MTSLSSLNPFASTTIQLCILTLLGWKGDTFSVCPRGLIPLHTAKALQLCQLTLLTLHCAILNASCCSTTRLLSEPVTSPNDESLPASQEDGGLLGHPICRLESEAHRSYVTCWGSQKEFVIEPGTETTSSQFQSSFFNHKMIFKRPGSETGLQHKNYCNSEGAPSTCPAGQSCLGCGQWAGRAITVSRVTEK